MGPVIAVLLQTKSLCGNLCCDVYSTLCVILCRPSLK